MLTMEWTHTHTYTHTCTYVCNALRRGSQAAPTTTVIYRKQYTFTHTNTNTNTYAHAHNANEKKQAEKKYSPFLHGVYAYISINSLARQDDGSERRVGNKNNLLNIFHICINKILSVFVASIVFIYFGKSKQCNFYHISVLVQCVPSYNF